MPRCAKRSWCPTTWCRTRARVPWSSSPASGVTAKCTETDTILLAARAAGLVIPSGCTMGICGTCKVRKLDGQVHMVHNGGITEEDIADDYILACCSNPIGHVTVEA